MYDRTIMDSAVEDVANGLSVRKAAIKWSVLRTTLNDLKLGHYESGSRPGPNTVLSTNEEQLLEEWIIKMSQRGLPLIRDNLLDSIQQILNEDNRQTPFNLNRPGDRWLKLFLKRHPALSERHVESISRSRGALTEACVRG